MQQGQIENFLDALAGQTPSYHTFQTFADGQANAAIKTMQLHGTLARHWPGLQRMNDAGAGVFVTVQGTDGNGRRKDNITQARALFVDSDTGIDLAVPLPPSARVRSSPGREHVYWFLAPGEDLARVPDAQRQLARVLGTDPSVHDIARVMRLPGTYHRKTEEPFLVELLELYTDRRYTIDQVLDSLDAPQPGSTVDFARFKAEKLLEQLRLASTGDRNNAVYRTTWQLKELLKEGILPQTTVAQIKQIASALGLSDTEIETCLRSALSSTEPSKVYAAVTQQDGNAAVATEPAPVHVLNSAHEVDIGRSLLRALGSETGRVKAIDGSIYTYGDPGVWTERQPTELRGILQGYHGAYVYDDTNKAARLNMTPRRRDGALDCALHDESIQAPGFWDDAPAGVLFENGFVSPYFGDLTARPASPALRCRTYLPVQWDLQAEAPNWSAFLGELFEGDQQQIDLLQEVIGAALLGIATQMSKCLILLGNGSNGKSVLLQAIAHHLFPSHLVSYVPPGRWGHEYYLYGLKDSLVNLVPELPGWNMITSDVFKAVISGDPILARPPYGRTVRFRPRAAHVFACNELPSTRDYSLGFWRRFAVLNFTNVFDGRSTSRDILERFEDEGSGIAKWAIAGGLRLLGQRVYTEPASVAAVREEWICEADPVRAFVTSCCGASEEYTTSFQLYTYFTQWCQATGRWVPSGVKFGRQLRMMGVAKKRVKSGYSYAIKVKPVSEWGLV